ncbi:MAG: hypothetical protein J6H21_04190 [Firmicutes bacterium]|nr:hypothetical protein [Bacillota bacterium]
MTDGFDVKINSKEVTCPSCGGVFHIDEPKCPFCGSFNPVGAEKEYMEKLYDLKDSTEELPELAQDEVEEDLKTNSKGILRLVVIVGVIAIIVIILFSRLGRRAEDMAMKEYKAREAFREAHLDEFNRLYEEGKDEELLELSISLMEDPGYDAIYRWEHYGYLNAYYIYNDLKDWQELYKTGDVDDLTYAVYAALDLTRGDKYYESTLTERDLEKIKEFEAYAENFLKENLKMTSEELDAWVLELKGDKGYIDRASLRRYLKENIKEDS